MATADSGIVCCCVGVGVVFGDGPGFGFERIMGGLGLLGVGGRGELGIAWTRGFGVCLVCLVRLVWGVDGAGGSEAPRLGGW